MADVLESHPDVPAPHGVQLDTFVDTREELATVARAYSRWEKGYNGDYMWLRVSFAGSVHIDVNIHRSLVCRKVVTGSHEEPARVVEDVEWICDEPLLSCDR